jgi:hypothetical protein
MNPKTAAALSELRETNDAEYTILSDDGCAIRVLVQLRTFPRSCW